MITELRKSNKKSVKAQEKITIPNEMREITIIEMRSFYWQEQLRQREIGELRGVRPEI